jgi:hypothetical protein
MGKHDHHAGKHGHHTEHLTERAIALATLRTTVLTMRLTGVICLLTAGLLVVAVIALRPSSSPVIAQAGPSSSLSGGVAFGTGWSLGHRQGPVVPASCQADVIRCAMG